MGLRLKPKRAERDPHCGPWTTCDRCGFISSQARMAFQFDFMGGSVPQNLGLLVCEDCIDDLTWQQKLLILPPDPAPVFNTRPEPYTVDETSWLTTQGGDIIDTQSGVPLITPVPDNPDVGVTTYLTAYFAAAVGSSTALYLDLLDGDPNAGGTSILRTITGSAALINLTTQLVTSANLIATNRSGITVSTAALAAANVSHAAIYAADPGVTPLAVTTVSATSPTIVSGVVVAFAALAIRVNRADP